MDIAYTRSLVVGVTCLFFGAMGFPCRIGAQTGRSDSVQFNRDIRPILSENCLHCHGFDPRVRQADLRLDQPENARADRGGYAAIVPGDVSRSEVIKRIRSTDPSVRMPPLDSGRRLTPQQIERLEAWIATGAEHEGHWAFMAPGRPTTPFVRHAHWPVNSIDCFVAARLEEEGLSTSPEAARSTLVRRATLDLTGLPPTLEESTAFISDTSPDAYERLVDRLLASPRYGEHMAVDWLDAARYADTHGYLFDTARSMWRWRDGLLGALNRDMPFDQFTIEQLAGDLLPHANDSQKLASGFNRNHIINNEAGVIPEEYLVENVFDRVETTASVWLGLTLQCARCHDHKYDPISQREYYEFYAFFNGVPELGLDGLNANAKPLMTAPTEFDFERQQDFSRRIVELDRIVTELEPRVVELQRTWETTSRATVVPVALDLLAHWPFDGDPHNPTHPCPVTSARIVGPDVGYVDGLIGQSLRLAKGAYVHADDTAGFDTQDPFSLAAWIRPTATAGRRSILSRMQDADKGFRGYTLQLVDGKLSLFLVHRFPDNMLLVQSKQAVEPNSWEHVAATYDGSGKAAGVTLYIGGKRVKTVAVNDGLTAPIFAHEPLWIGNGHPGAFFDGALDEVRIYRRRLAESEVGRLPGVSLATLLAVEPVSRNSQNPTAFAKTF